jgi:hypothetical protein
MSYFPAILKSVFKFLGVTVTAHFRCLECSLTILKQYDVEVEMSQGEKNMKPDWDLNQGLSGFKYILAIVLGHYP